MFGATSNKEKPKETGSEIAVYVITPKNVLVNLFLAISKAFSPLVESLYVMVLPSFSSLRKPKSLRLLRAG